MSRANLDAPPYELDFEFVDGTICSCEVTSMEEAWETVNEMQQADPIAYAWRDGLPWFSSEEWAVA